MSKSFGTRKSTVIRAGPRRQELFIFRIHADISDDDIKQFLVGENVVVHELERLSKDDSWTKSYRVAIETNDLSALLQPDFWPDGIGCRRYWRKRTLNTDNGQSNNNVRTS